MDIDLEERLEQFSNGGDTVIFFEKLFQDIRDKGIALSQSNTPYQPVALLLLDINMPIMTGFEVCKKVKALYKNMNDEAAAEGNNFQKVLRPVICFLSQYERNTMQYFIDTEEMADCYLEKPLPLSEIKSLTKLLNIKN